jgi:hypothetical protein
MARFAKLEKIHRALQIVLHELPAASGTVHTGENAWVRRGVYYPVHLADRLQIAHESKVSVNEANARLFENGTVYLATSPRQIVDSDNVELVRFTSLAQFESDRSANETATTGDQDFHDVVRYPASW